LNHLGFRVRDEEALVALQRRLETTGIATTREDGVECCYSRQSKFWFNDPDGNLWEIYFVEQDIDRRGRAKTADSARQPAVERRSAAVWAHRLGESVSSPLFVENGRGRRRAAASTFNARLTADEQAHILQEAWRVLKPGGRLTFASAHTRKPSCPTLAPRYPVRPRSSETVPTPSKSRRRSTGRICRPAVRKLDDGPC